MGLNTTDDKAKPTAKAAREFLKVMQCVFHNLLDKLKADRPTN